MADTICIPDSYKMPPDEILDNRKEFYCLKRGFGESIEMWLNEVQNHINCCDFSKFVEFFLIDKFVCELNKDEREIVCRANLWSLQRLNEYFVKRNFNVGHMNSNVLVNLNKHMWMDDVKSEPVCFQM